MAKTSLNDLLAQKAALEKQIADFQREQRSDAIAKVKAMMAEYGVTLADISSSKPVAAAPAAGKAKRAAKPAGAPAKKVAAKFRNPATGDSWSGRGLKPRWLTAALASGRALSDFAI